MFKTTKNGRLVERLVSFFNDSKSLSDEERKEFLGIIAENEEPTDERRRQEFENRVVERVLKEMSLKDGKQMIDYLFINLAHRFEQKGHLKRMVGEHLSRRMRALAGLTTFFVIAFSMVGFYSMTSSAKDAGAKIAREEIEKHHGALDIKFVAQQGMLEKQGDKFEAALEKQAVNLKNDLDERIDNRAGIAEERFKETAANIERAVMLAQAQMTNTLLQFQTNINDTANKAKKDVEDKTQKVFDDAESRTSTIIKKLTEDTEAQFTKVKEKIDDLGRTVVLQLEATGKLYDDKWKLREDEQKKAGASSGTSSSINRPEDRGLAVTETSGRSPGKQSDDVMTNLMIEAIRLAVERKYDFEGMLSLATKAAKEAASDIIRSAFSAMLDMPSTYKDEERSSAADLMLAKSIDPQERLHNATECMMAAARAGDEALFNKAQAAREDNFLSLALGRNVFVEVAEAYVTGKSGAEIDKLLAEVDYESLQTRGYLNLYAIAKKAVKKGDLPEPSVRKRQDELLREIRGSNFIDRPSDYTTAYFLVDALNAAPFLRDSAITEVLDLVEKEVFKGKNTEDPWKLKDLIATVRAKLAAPPAATPQPQQSDPSGPVPTEQGKPQEPKPEQQNP